jgi:L-alanine-DL-glutamate epimerase-like enolase superfamily enzyme
VTMRERADAVPGTVKIRAVETIPLRLPFTTAFTIASPSGRTRDHVDVLLVRLVTDAGVAGVGETQAWRRQGSDHTLASLAAVVRDLFEPLLLGRSPFDIAATLDALGRASANLYALAPVADALYDLVGRLLDVPVCVLLGAAGLRPLAVGAEIGIPDSEAEAVDLAVEHARRGFRHLRVKIGLDPDQDLARIRAIRARLGDAVQIRADANAGLRFAEALPLLKRLEELDLEFVEQPLALEDLDGMAALARATRIPIAADESLTTDRSLVEIAAKRAASIVQTKVAKNGGLHHVRRLWTIAEACGIGILPGNHPATSVAVASVTHLCAAWPTLTLVGDFQTGLDHIVADVARTPVVVKDGTLSAPDGPGFGIELDPDAIERFRVKV